MAACSSPRLRHRDLNLAAVTKQLSARQCGAHQAGDGFAFGAGLGCVSRPSRTEAPLLEQRATDRGQPAAAPVLEADACCRQCICWPKNREEVFMHYARTMPGVLKRRVMMSVRGPQQGRAVAMCTTPEMPLPSQPQPRSSHNRPRPQSGRSAAAESGRSAPHVATGTMYRLASLNTW
jgi:hypothetical protein